MKRFAVALMIVVSCLLSCSRTDPKAPAQEGERERLRFEAEVRELASQFNAVSDWQTTLGSDLRSSPLYTIEVEKALLRSDGRPLLLPEMVVEDVRRSGDQYVVHFGVLFGPGPREITFVLACPAKTAEEIVARAPAAELPSEYNVIAVVRDVQKVSGDFPVITKQDDQFEIEREAKNRFEARGECVAVRPL
jgi:hypothetical protein